MKHDEALILEVCPGRLAEIRLLQIEVCYPDESIRCYPIDSKTGWRFDPASQMLVIGKGIGRIHIPYIQITSMRITEYSDEVQQPPSPFNT